MPTLSFFRNRVYDQATGRWTQEDPIGIAGGLNLYQFNGNNPASFTDPFGLCPPAWMCQLVVGFAGRYPRAAQAISSLVDQEIAGFQCGAQAFHNCAVPPSGTGGALLGQMALALGTAQSSAGSVAGSGSGAEVTLGRTIAGGHAMKHLGEFESLGIRSSAQMAQHIDNVVTNAAGTNVRSLGRGRTAYYEDASNTVVIKNPGSLDGGTAFRPANGRAYFDDLQ